MINTFESVKVLIVEQITDISTAFKPATANAFHIFLAPADGSSYSVGDVVTITAKPVNNDSATSVPIVVGDWNPVVLESVSASGVDLTEFDVYVSEIANY